MTTILILPGLITVLVGLLGTIYPAIPDLGLMFGGAWLLACAGSCQVYGTNTLIPIGITAAFSVAMDCVSGVLGTRYTGASRQALWGTFIGDITGAFLSLPDLLLDPLVGTGVSEFIAKRDMLQADKVSLGTFIGFIIGMIAKIGRALAIVLALLLVWIFNLLIWS